jgi:hypothetical protein
MKGFIGLANYFRDNIPNMSSLLQPLQKMISGYTEAQSKWTPTLEQQYEAVKTLGDCQKLFWMDENLPVFADASDYGCGAYLFQKDSDGKEYPFSSYRSRFLPSRNDGVRSNRRRTRFSTRSTNLNTSCVTDTTLHRSP